MPTARGGPVGCRDRDDCIARRWGRLKGWVERHGSGCGSGFGGGYVHPGLALAVIDEDAEVDQHEGEEEVGFGEEPSRRHEKKAEEMSDRDDEALATAGETPSRPSPNQGIVATRSISKGTLLLRIPSGLTLGRGRRHNSRSSVAEAAAATTTTTTAPAPATTAHVDGGGDDKEESSHERDHDDDAAPLPPSSKSGGDGSPWLECLLALYAAQREQQRREQVSSNGLDESGLRRERPPPSGQPVPSPSAAAEASWDRPPRTWEPYLDLLPARFDTVLDWTDDELRFLAGTSLQEDHPSREHMLRELRTRYVANVRPRLAERRLVPDRGMHNDNDNQLELEFERFAWACQAISTRCFHVANPPSALPRTRPDPSHPSRGDDNNFSTFDDDDDEGRPAGPYFLPVIDLLNHSNGSDRVTTLTASAPARDGDDPHRIAYYEMVAERDVQAGEPITHSYGNDLTSAQCLRTFGFVPREATTKIAADKVEAGAPRSNHLSPVILSKETVLKCCERTAEQERNSRDAAHHNGVRVDDETWELPAPDVMLGRDASSLPDHIVVTASCPLSDDLVTLLSLPFLPDDAYQELVVPEQPATEFSSSSSSPSVLISRLDASVLEDPYLGRLVGQSLLEVVKEKAGTYGAIRIEGLEELDDMSLLRHLLSWEAGSGGSSTPASARLGAMGARTRQRLMYALTIRLEERSCLEALRREAVRILVRATDGDDTDDGEDSGSGIGGEEPRTKRQNTSAYE